jgi:hypothetical protein
MLEAFSNLKIDTKNILNIQEIPGQVEAESFLTNEGLSMENCSDEGGGYNMGYTDDGDYLDYLVNIPIAGAYSIAYRVASGNSAGGKIDLQLINEPGEIHTIQTVSVSNTNGWQNWATINKTATLPSGEYTLRMFVNKREFNLNWMKFTLLIATATSDLETKKDWFSLYPNPAMDKLFVDFSAEKNATYKLKIINLFGVVVKETIAENADQTVIELDGMANGLYILQLIDGNRRFSKQFVISK